MVLSRSWFLAPRGGSNYWGRRSDLIEAWRRADQAAVPPLTVEWACILDCNARCPFCPYHKAQLQQCAGVVSVGSLAAENDRTSPSMALARLVLDRSRDAGIEGVLFTGGGEPLIWPPLVDSLRYSHALGMDNAVYTNGLLLGIDTSLADRLIDPRNGLVFIRFSVNAVSAAAVAQHWGLSDPSEIERQFVGLRRLLEARNRLELPTTTSTLSVQISTIVDKHTIGDLEEICDRVATIFSESRRTIGAEDVMVVRPLTLHGRKRYSSHDHDDWVIREILRVCGGNGTGRGRLAGAGVPLFLGFGLDRVETGDALSYDEVIDDEYAQRDVSLANGVFLTVGPDLTAYVSTEHNCGPADFAIGSLKTQAVREIYASPRRRALLSRMNEARWGPSVAQPTARTARLDRIARAVRSGALTEEDLEAVRVASYRSHKLLLD